VFDQNRTGLMAKKIFNAKSLLARTENFSQPIRTFECNIREDWTDFNGHMNEARYLDCFSNASDALMQLIGCDEAYIALGKSFFTVETHIQHLDEVRALEPVYVTTQILEAKGKKLHMAHLLFHENGEGDRLLASGEQMLLHVDLDSRKTSEPENEIAQKMRFYGDGHKNLPSPDWVGRAIGQKR
jgi:carnitine 3-dehydrogenase